MSDNSLIAALRKAARQASSKPEDRIEWKAADRIEALSTSPAGQEVREAFDLLVELEAALILTANYSGETRVGDFVRLREEFHRVQKWLHSRQHDAAPSVEPAGNGREGNGHD